MNENDSQQPKGGGPIRKSDRGLETVCINGDKGICCQDQNKHSTWHIVRSKRDCLWVGLALPAGLKWSYKEIVSGNKRSVNQCNENTYLKDLDL